MVRKKSFKSLIMTIAVLLFVSFSYTSIFADTDEESGTSYPIFLLRAESDDGEYSGYHMKKQLVRSSDGYVWLPDLPDPPTSLKGYKFDHYYLNNSIIKVTTTTKTEDGKTTVEKKEELIPYRSTIKSLKRTSETVENNGSSETIDVRFAVWDTGAQYHGQKAVFIKDETKVTEPVNSKTVKSYDTEKDGKTLTGYTVDGKYVPISNSDIETTSDYEEAVQKLAKLYHDLGIRIQYQDETDHRVADPLLPNYDGYQMTMCSDFAHDFFKLLTGISLPTSSVKAFSDENLDSIKVLKMDEKEIGDAYSNKELAKKIIDTAKVGDVIYVGFTEKGGHVMIVTDYVKDKNGNVVDLLLIHSTGYLYGYDETKSQVVPDFTEGGVKYTYFNNWYSVKGSRDWKTLCILRTNNNSMKNYIFYKGTEEIAPIYEDPEKKPESEINSVNSEENLSTNNASTEIHEDKTQNTKNAFTPKTGDKNDIALFLIVLSIAGAGAFVLVRKNERK